MPSFELQPITVRTGSADKVARLVLVDGELTAVLVRLDDEGNEGNRGKWFLEVEFRRLNKERTFDTLEEAEAWLRQINTE